MKGSSTKGRYFITGIGGFLGSHLAEFLLAEGLPVYGTIHKDFRNVEHTKDKLALLPCDILDRQQVETAVVKTQPQVVFHLAAQSLPVLSWKDPEATFRVNVFGTLNLLEAVRKSGIDPTILVSGSSAEYGFTRPDEMPIQEEKALRPATPYGVSKAAADLLAYLYWRTYGMKVICGRPFFVIGPRKRGDVCSDFARGIVAVEKGQQPSLKVGNLEAVRDFLDVQDAIGALWLLVEKGTPGEVYNLCSGVGHKIGEVLRILLAMAMKPVPVEQDPARLRPADEPVVIGDNAKLRALGWEPQVPLQVTLARVLEFWRQAYDPATPGDNTTVRHCGDRGKWQG
jgi:GDP-4-dehydro-6-deoxy-D-mannose reductase